MIKYIFAGIVFIHGLIHLMGYSKSFHYPELKNITQPIPRPIGLLWITACILFIAMAVMFLLEKEWWWKIGIAAIGISQLVIILSWKDARYGTIVNIIIILFMIWQLLKK